MTADTATLTLERPPEPRRRPKLVADGMLAMLIFVFTEAMLFAGLISAHAIVRSQTVGQMWPPYGQPRLPVEETALNTAALMASGVVLVMAHLAYRRASERAELPLLLAILLGAFFVGFQGAEWVALLREGPTLTSSTYGAFFYLIVGTHALHAVAALAAMAWAFTRLRAGRLRASELGAVSVFWYFVVLVWPVLYWKVYL